MNALTKTAAAIALGTAATLPAFAHDHGMKADSVAAIVVGSEDHTTLLAAVQAGGLVDALSGEGTLTVFAPTNEAFAAVDPAALEALLKPENKDDLVAVLSCHVLGTSIMSEDLVKLISESETGAVQVESISGCKLTAQLEGDAVVITSSGGTSATVTAVDLMAQNGVVHVIDTVLLP